MKFQNVIKKLGQLLPPITEILQWPKDKGLKCVHIQLCWLAAQILQALVGVRQLWGVVLFTVVFYNLSWNMYSNINYYCFSYINLVLKFHSHLSPTCND